MNRIADEQKRQNDHSRGRWDRYAPHRGRVTRLLADAAPPHGGLCVLGAGNSNDLDLAALLQVYDQVHLVDLDPHALQSGLDRQGWGDTERIRLYGNVDLTWIADRLAVGTPERPLSDAELDLCAETMAAHPPLDLPSPFDTVASVCLLTQLIQCVTLSLGERHPRCVETILRLRAQHLGLLLELLRPGGTAVLVLDFVSSQTCPELPQVPESHLFDKAVELISRRNFFTGVNPFVIRHLFESDPALTPAVDSVQMTAPWLWDFGPRVYLVCAIVIRRKATAPRSPDDR
ncbi:MAG: hypothetical protein GX575_15590 [Candidatus Anammoximicrobium sp.]|nr:hypothetical protein [Candidatus Anammoximicrobium sp.]